MNGPRRTAVALAVWTLFVWLTRVRNTLGDDDLSTSSTVISLLLAASFVVLAAVVLDSLRHGDRRGARVALLALWTVLVWPVRAVQIATADHGAGFVVVHLALGAISIALAVVAVRANGGFSRARANR